MSKKTGSLKPTRQLNQYDNVTMRLEPVGNKKIISKYQANRLHKSNITAGPTELTEDETSSVDLLEYRFKLIQQQLLTLNSYSQRI
jgi:hypothetical protein